MHKNVPTVSTNAQLYLRRIVSIFSLGFHPNARKVITLFLAFLLIGTINKVQGQQWPVIASEQDIASSVSNYSAIATSLDGAVTSTYVVYTESNIAKVKKFDGSSWEAVGSPVSDGSATYTRIYIDDNGRILVSYVDASNGNRLAVKTYNQALNVWEPLGGASNLYVSTGSVTFSTGQYSSTPRSALAFDGNNVPYIIFSEGAGLNPYVKKFNGTGWETVGGMPVSTQRAIGVGIAIDGNDVPYIVYINQATATSTTGNLVVYRFDNSWQQITVPSPVSGGSSTSGATVALRHSAITFNNSWNPVVSYFNAGNSNRATVIIYNKATGVWSLSGVISSRDIFSNALTRDDAGNVYAAFIDAISNGSGRSVAKVIRMTAGTTTWNQLRNTDLPDGIDEPAGNLSIAVNKTGTPYVVYTKPNSSSVVTPIVRFFVNGTPPPPPPPPQPDPVVTTPKQVERLDRGLVAVRSGSNSVYVGWRLFGTDPSGISFNVYRNGTKINNAPVSNSTNYVDSTTESGSYTIRPVINGVEQEATKPAIVWLQNYLNIPLQKPAGGVTPDGVAYTYTANDCSVGDLDGDGEYEIILKWDPTNAKDNSQSGYTGNVYLDAYKLNGTRLWRIDLGKNIRAGAHYTQFMVYDLDGDGRAELACKTADGTIDGAGVAIGNPIADHRNSGGYILTGPEFLTVFNGLTGAAMATVDYLPARGSVASWGDNYGNRVDRFIAAVAYLDGARPSLVMGRGYYTRMVRAAWDWRDGKLTLRWIFDSNSTGNGAYAGQGNHQMTVGDVDGDGKQEVFNGSSAINDNGNGLWSNGMGHGDALHLSDIDPDRPGLELWQPYEYPPGNGGVGAALVDAKTGARIFTVSEATADVGRGLTADIDPRHKGYEVWAARGNLYTAKGLQIGTSKPSMNFAVWWDGDLSRELLDGTTLSKWNYNTNRSVALFSAAGASSNNSTKSTPALSADLLGDWREEVIFRTSDNNNLVIYTTTAPTEHRIYTLMHDPQYRVAIAWQNSGYNQPPHTGFYLGTDMGTAPVPNIEYVKDILPPVAVAKNIRVVLNGGQASVSEQDVDGGSYDAFGIDSIHISKTNFDCSNIGENEVVLTVTDAAGNTDTAHAIITVIGSIPQTPVITVTRTDQTFTGADVNTVFLGYGAQQLTLTATSPGHDEQAAYSWLPVANLGSMDSFATVFTPAAAGKFIYTVTTTNAYGCTATSAPVTLNVVDARCGPDNSKVVICHKGKEICVAPPAVPAHLAHGCSIGSCSIGPEIITGRKINTEGNNMEVGNRLDIHPNPVSAGTRVTISLAKPGKYSLQLLHANGTLVRNLSRGEGDAIIYYQFSADNLAKGSYYLKLETGKEVITKLIIIQ
jgi:hypothetical protein